jgi:D-alanyl-D-alanine carboxypeptidase
MMRIKLPRVFSPLQPIPELIGHSGSTGSFAYYCPEKALYLAGTMNQITAQRRTFQLIIQIANALQ